MTLRWVFVLLLAGCSAELPPPDAWTVQPSRGWNGEATDAVVLGASFYPRVIVDAQTGSSVLDDRFVVQLLGPVGGASRETWTLQDVRLQSYDRIDVTIPAGLDVGTYDLRVASPDGASDLLPEAYTVSSSQADHLRIRSERVSLQVHETAWVEVELLDPVGELVLDDFSVAIRVVGDVGSPDAIHFVEGGLEDQAEDTPNAIRGSLGSDGAALVGFTSDTPQTVTVTVAPLSTRSPDSSVLGDELRLDFAHGSELSAELTLPADPLEVIAGEPFDLHVRLVDQHGNPVSGTTKTLLLRNECGPPLWSASVQVHDEADVAVELKRATGTADCPEDRIVVAAGPAGSSAPIQVRAGEADHLAIVAGPTTVTAGSLLALKALVTPVDRYANAADWTPAPLVVTDSLGGLADTRCTLGIPTFCEATPMRAGESVSLLVEEAGGGLSGRSNAYDVVAGSPVQVLLEAPAEAVAGEVVPVAVAVVDALGNVLLRDAVDVGLLALSTGAELPQCALAAVQPDERTWLDCVFTHAVATTSLQAEYRGLSAVPTPFAVVHGPLEVVEVRAPQMGTAGDWFSLELAAFDAWANPVLGPLGAPLRLKRSGEALGEAALDGTGRAFPQVQLTVAGTAPILVTQLDAARGQSNAVRVDAGTAEGLEVSAPPWAWVGQPSSVSVRAVDAWSNTAPISASLSLGAQSGGTGPAVAAALTNGEATVELVWAGVVLDDVVEASADLLSGRSDLVAAVAACGLSGPVASITFEGARVGRTCATAPSGDSLLIAELTSSTAASGHSLVRSALLFEGGQTVWGDALTPGSVDSVGLGPHTVQGLVIQDDGCASTARGSTWTGLDDGSVTGPLGVTPARASISAQTGHTRVDLSGGVTCRGQVAAGATVLARTDRGALFSSPGPTGEGLAVLLDGSGGAQVELDMQGVLAGGIATITVGDAAGSATGEAEVLVTGDAVAPQVWQQSPSGPTDGTVPTVELVFSEAIASSTVSTSRFELRGPTGVAITDATLTAPNRVLLALSPPIKANLAVWTVWASAALTDLDGNPLDGERTGLTADYTGTFGALVPSAPSATSCALSTPGIRPDGDDGLGAQADTVQLAAQASATPTGWRFEVLGPDGEIVASEAMRGGGASTSWTWDGRDGTGAVVAAGDYLVAAAPTDSNGSAGGACAEALTVDFWGGR